ncbi:hypothetical protein HAX54_041726 [Datura stramonium]|uniref:Uncharacterized protein n=1 Tax=Datura stramonium TaxID=4076 RepID=A0ABS8W302_DATST|nr:hypothetical protein [Datura stramonium]
MSLTSLLGKPFNAINFTSWQDFRSKADNCALVAEPPLSEGCPLLSALSCASPAVGRGIPKKDVNTQHSEEILHGITISSALTEKEKPKPRVDANLVETSPKDTMSNIAAKDSQRKLLLPEKTPEKSWMNLFETNHMGTTDHSLPTSVKVQDPKVWVFEKQGKKMVDEMRKIPPKLSSEGC